MLRFSARRNRQSKIAKKRSIADCDLCSVYAGKNSTSGMIFEFLRFRGQYTEISCPLEYSFRDWMLRSCLCGGRHL